MENSAGDSIIQSKLQELQIFIQNSEWSLILFMQQNGKWTGPLPPGPPPNYSEQDGSVDLGLASYWLNNPKSLNVTFEEFAIIEGLVYLWQREYPTTFPKSLMNAINYDFLGSSSDHLVYKDGSVLSMEKYATYDQKWFLAFLNLVQTTILSLWKYGGTYPAVTAKPIPISGQTPGKVRIAILGDWGTGDTRSKDVMQQLLLSRPDYIIHVGDVYYSGTPAENSTNGKHYFGPGEEQANLVDAWPGTYNGKSFTLNSNHEMYSGANGYFDVALNTQSGPFTAQQGQGCFVLQFNDWNFLGLDSAYMGSTADAFMTGTLGPTSGTQYKWIQGLNLDPSKTIVFTHHNGFADDVSAMSPLFDEVSSALNGDPYAWYWGHVHNGIVYKSPISVPEKVGSSTMRKTNTYSRCLGHAALPYGNATALAGNSQIAWRETLINPLNQQLFNGYAILDIDASGSTVSAIKEYFFNLRIDSPRYSKQIFPYSQDAEKYNFSEEFRKVVEAEDHTFQLGLYNAIERHLGPAMKDRDASLVACSDPGELKTVKDNFLKGKLGLADSEGLDEAIQKVCETMGTSNRHKNRAEFYYLLTVYFGKQDTFL